MPVNWGPAAPWPPSDSGREREAAETPTQHTGPHTLMGWFGDPGLPCPSGDGTGHTPGPTRVAWPSPHGLACSAKCGHRRAWFSAVAVTRGPKHGMAVPVPRPMGPGPHPHTLGEETQPGR